MAPEKWVIIDQIYQAMPGWKGYIDDGCPAWELEGGKSIFASVEPSGLLIEGDATQASFDIWIAEFISKASEQLGFTVRDAEA